MKDVRPTEYSAEYRNGQYEVKDANRIAIARVGFDGQTHVVCGKWSEQDGRFRVARQAFFDSFDAAEICAREWVGSECAELSR